MNTPALPRHNLLQPVLPGAAQIKFVGLGGIGSMVAKFGSLFIASLRSEARLVFIDGDSFEPSNTTRMFVDQFGNKAQVTVDTLLPFLSQAPVSLIAVEEYVSPENVQRLIRAGDIVLLTVDNHATRKLVSDHCARLADICLISGGNDPAGPDSSGAIRRGTYGNVQVFWRQNGQERAPDLTRFHPEIGKPADRLPTDRSCTELISSSPQILFTNLAVASAMLNALWLYLSGALHYSELSLDIADGLMRPSLPLSGVSVIL